MHSPEKKLPVMLKKLLLSLLFLLSFMAAVQAQNRTCATMSHLEALEKQFPGTKAQLQQTNKAIQAVETQAGNNKKSATVLVIPVVVHVVYKTQAQNISQAQIESQIDVLNEDFNKRNADTVNTPVPFRPLAGKMRVQFVLAQRDPNGDPTNGITRTLTNQNFFTDDDAIKFNNLGGKNGWDRDRYLNIWVGNLGGGILGYAQFPGTGAPETDGVVIRNVYFGRTGSVVAPFNKGRTATHEVGHWLGLFHIWGDEPACQRDDLVADTPLQKSENYGCPSFPQGSTTSGGSCTGSTPGSMFMNFMDYTDDACMNMFSQGQVSRMQAAVSTSRPTIATSNGSQPVTTLNLDASVFQVLSPKGSSCNPVFTPKIILKNRGTTTLTSATITYQINSATRTYNWTGSLATYATALITLPVENVNSGSHTFTAVSSLPNGQTDNDPSNDSQTINFTVTPVVPGLNLPYTESFECTTCGSLPYPGFTLNNPDNSYTWQQSSRAIHGNRSVFVNNYDYYFIGQADELIFNSLNLTSAPSPELTFQVAYTPTGFGGPYGDTLEVLASVDCGFSYTSIYKKTKQALATAPPIFSAFTPTQSQWRMETVPLNNFAGNTNVILKFRHTTGYENNLYLDDIRVSGVLGIKEVSDHAALTVFPNPTTGLLTIQAEKYNGKEVTASVKNALGQEILLQKTKLQGNNLPLDLRGNPAGLYIIQLAIGNEILTRKVVLSE